MKHKLLSVFVWGAAFILFLLLAAALAPLEEFEPLIDKEVSRHLAQSGVSHGVTAVLLNFRSLDTLLEVGVLLIALIAIYAIRPYFHYKPLTSENIITNTYVSLLFPLILLSSFYVFYGGSYQSGGAFGAAALLAGGIIVLQLVKPRHFYELRETLLRFAYVSGLLFFVFVGVATLFFGSFLEYRNEVATVAIVSIEAFLTLSLAIILASYFINAVQRVE